MPGPLELLPAVDVQSGQAVRLGGGIEGGAEVLGDPIEIALDRQRQGAEWLHLVDVDAAFGRSDNRDLLAEVVRRLDIPVQVGGGIGDDEALAWALGTGCRRAVIAAGALERPGWCEAAIADHGDRVTVAIDVRGRRLAPRGGAAGGADLDEVLGRLDGAGCARYVVTDVERDGRLRGPNLDLLRRVCAATDRPVVASGGITDLADLEAVVRLGGIGVEGVIIGAALHTGRFGLAEALALTRAGEADR